MTKVKQTCRRMQKNSGVPEKCKELEFFSETVDFFEKIEIFKNWEKQQI